MSRDEAKVQVKCGRDNDGFIEGKEEYRGSLTMRVQVLME